VVGVAGLLRLTNNLFTSESSGASSGHGDYDEKADVVRFLEDGSFIGQYGGPKRQPTAAGSDDEAPPVVAAAGATSVSMTALSTFV